MFTAIVGSELFAKFFFIAMYLIKNASIQLREQHWGNERNWDCKGKHFSLVRPGNKVYAVCT